MQGELFLPHWLLPNRHLRRPNQGKRALASWAFPPLHRGGQDKSNSFRRLYGFCWFQMSICGTLGPSKNWVSGPFKGTCLSLEPEQLHFRGAVHPAESCAHEATDIQLTAFIRASSKGSHGKLIALTDPMASSRRYLRNRS